MKQFIRISLTKSEHATLVIFCKLADEKGLRWNLSPAEFNELSQKVEQVKVFPSIIRLTWDQIKFFKKIATICKDPMEFKLTEMTEKEFKKLSLDRPFFIAEVI